MIPKFLTEATNAKLLVLSLSENMNSYREMTMKIPVPRWLARWLAALPRWLAALNTLTVGQVAGLAILPMLWHHRDETDRMVKRFRSIDISQYTDEGTDRLCKILEDSCDFMDKMIREREKLQSHRVLAFHWEYKQRVWAKEELEDILETWILARNPEFQRLFGSVLDEFGKYVETAKTSMTDSVSRDSGQNDVSPRT